MRWRRRHLPAPPSEATEARIRAEVDLERRKEDAGRVRAMLRYCASIRAQNHIEENLKAIMRGGSA